MPTKKEDKKKLRHSEWVEQIAKCQSNGMKIKKRLHYKFQECNHCHKTHTMKREIYKKNGNQGTKRQQCKETENLNGCIVSFIE